VRRLILGQRRLANHSNLQICFCWQAGDQAVLVQKRVPPRAPHASRMSCLVRTTDGIDAVHRTNAMRQVLSYEFASLEAQASYHGLP